MVDRYGADSIDEHFADTSDTLCYATNENQSATRALIADGGDLALIVGGFNSSNTSHLVELCEQAMPTFFISDESCLDSSHEIQHFNLHTKTMVSTRDWLPATDHATEIVLTAGASCPDALLDRVVQRVVRWFPDARPIEHALAPFLEPAAS